MDMNNFGVFLVSMPFTVCGLIMCVIGFVILVRSRVRTKRMSSRAIGRVVRNELHEMRRVRYTYRDGRHAASACCYFPVIEFETWNGDYVTVESNCGTGCEKYHPGDTVQVWYNRSNPKEFRLDNYSMFVYMPVVLLLGMGVCFVFVGITFGALALAGAVSM